jgi:hypothetical protein
MKTRNVVMAVCTLGVLTVAGVARAQEPDLGRLVHKVIDAAAGTEVRIYQPRPGDIVWTVGDETVRVRKLASRARTETTVEAGGDRAVVTLTPGAVSVERRGRTVTVRAGDRRQAAAMRELIERSEAMRQGIALLGRVSLGARSPIEHQLKTTRAILLAVGGYRSSVAALRAMAELNSEPRVMAASYQTPTECWETYAKEAIAAAKEYEDCTDDLAWYEVLDLAACAAIFDLRAIGAFAWWMRCVGIGDLSLP